MRTASYVRSGKAEALGVRVRFAAGRNKPGQDRSGGGSAEAVTVGMQKAGTVCGSRNLRCAAVCRGRGKLPENEGKPAGTAGKELLRKMTEFLYILPSSIA